MDMINISKTNDKNVKKSLLHNSTKQNEFSQYIHQSKQYDLKYITIKNSQRH